MEGIAILGLGLMGGSLARSLRRRADAGPLRGYARRAETREAALAAGLLDAAFADPADAVRGAALVVVCVPVLTIPELVRRCAPALAGGAVVTDVGSTKAWLAAEAPAALAGTEAVFVGSHPIAGSEKAGIEAARADLYDGAWTIVTPAADSPPVAVAAVSRLWERAGARVRRMSPAEHDRRMARTSHLPHLAAALLARTVGRDGDAAELGPFCGPGFRDSTRVADGSPGVWMDIVRSNRQPLRDEAEALAQGAAALAAALREADDEAVQALLERARDNRRELLAAGNDEKEDGAERAGAGDP